MEKKESQEEELIFAGKSEHRIEFTYDEEEEKTESEEEEVLREEKEDEGRPQKEGLAAWFGKHKAEWIVAVILILALGGYALFRSGSESAPDDLKSSEGDNTDESNTFIPGTYEDYLAVLTEYMKEIGETVVIAEENAEYPVNTCIITDLDNDGIYPEALIVRKREIALEDSLYSDDIESYRDNCIFITYCFSKAGGDTPAVERQEYTFSSEVGIELSGVILNDRSDSYVKDIIVTYAFGKESRSAFFLYQQESYRRLGAIDGVPLVQTIMYEGGSELERRQCYDLDGIYQVRTDFEQDDFKNHRFQAVTSYRISEADRIEKVVLFEEWADDFTELIGESWYMRRPILAYSFDAASNTIVTLEGDCFTVIGYRNGYYLIETDAGQRGFINIENGMVTLQRLPMEEVFTQNTTLPGTDDLYAYITPLIQEEGIYEPMTEYWVDLNGDATPEKVCLRYVRADEAQLYINGQPVSSYTLPVGKPFYITDLDKTDGLLEIGCIIYETVDRREGAESVALYQYDGKQIWNVFRSGNYCLMLFSEETGEPLYQDGRVPANGELYNLYQLELVYNAQTHKLQTAEPEWEGRMYEPLACTIATDFVLYTDTTFETEVGTLYVGDTAVIDKFVGEESGVLYSFHLVADNGLEGYIPFNEMVDAFWALGVWEF